MTFGGRIGLNGFEPGDLNLTATGEQMNLRYPEGFRSSSTPPLAARHADVARARRHVTVRDGVWTRRFEPTRTFSSRRRIRRRPSAAPGRDAFPSASTSRSWRRRTLRIENNLAHVVASADLTLQGTYDNPLLFGRADIERGELVFEGNRYSSPAGTSTS